MAALVPRHNLCFFVTGASVLEKKEARETRSAFTYIAPKKMRTQGTGAAPPPLVADPGLCQSSPLDPKESSVCCANRVVFYPQPTFSAFHAVTPSVANQRPVLPMHHVHHYAHCLPLDGGKRLPSAANCLSSPPAPPSSAACDARDPPLLPVLPSPDVFAQWSSDLLPVFYGGGTVRAA